MQIFKSEIEDGLEHALQSSASISFAAVVEPCLDKNLTNNIKHVKSLAALNDSDLYYVQSILVTSSWNKNDDIFDKEEVWLARNTPEDKPTNLEHDEGTIIGHITSNWPITEDGILINENTPIENLPDKYHILTGSVIYKAFTNPDLKERSDKLIAEIEDGQKYVSMECFFKGFDYGLVNKSTGEYKVLARNDNTAYLTKYLRSYGGMGEHDNHKIGRVLRNITFSGKGFVNKPANPDSIIFTKELVNIGLEKKITQKNEDLSIAGVSINQSNSNVENITMILETEVTELKTKVEAMQDCSEAVKDAQTAASTLQEKTVELENTIKANETALADLQSALEAANLANLEKEEAAKKMKEEMAKKEEEMSKVKSELDTISEIVAVYKTKEEEMLKKEKKMKRMASLIEAGLDNDVATATVDKFENLDDESFEAMTSLFAAKMPPWLNKDKKEEEKMAEKKKASEEVIDASVLETAEEEKVDLNLGVGGETTESSVEATRAALVEFVCSRLGKTL